MSSTKVINLGNTCSAFGFNADSVPPTTTGNYYAFTSPNPASYVMLGDNNFPYIVNMDQARIPAFTIFNYNMFNIGLMWSPNIPGGTYSNGITYSIGDSRLRILTSYWLENLLGIRATILPTSGWTIVQLETPASPSTSNFTIVRMPTDPTTTTQKLNGIGWTTASALLGQLIKKTTAPSVFTNTATIPIIPAATYYLTAYSSLTPNSSVSKNVYNTSFQTVDLNSALMPTGTFATITVPALIASTYTSSINSVNGTINITTTVTAPSDTAVISKLLASGIYTNILVGSFGQVVGTTGVISNGTKYSSGPDIWLQTTQPTADPDPVFSTASENGIIFIPLNPTVSGTPSFVNPVLGITPSTSAFAINSYFNLNPSGTPPSFGYFLTYPLNYEEANPSIEAGSDFLLLTPDNAYIVYVNGSGALALQPSSKLTASPSTINFQTYGGYWAAQSVDAVTKGFKLAYVTTNSPGTTIATYYMKHIAGGTVSTDTLAANASTYTCMHCSPVNYLCQLGQ